MGALRLEALLESAQLLHGSLDLDHLLKHLLRTVMGRFLASRALIAVSRDGVLRVSIARGLSTVEAGQILDQADARRAGIRRFFPIGDGKMPVGMLGLGDLMREMDAEEESFLDALLGIAASGIDNATAHLRAQALNTDLNRKVQDLRTLLELVQSLTSTLDPTRVAHLLALTLTGRWAVGRYVVAAWKEGHPLVLQRRGLEFPDLDDLRESLAAVTDAGLVENLPNGPLRDTLRSGKGEALIPLRLADRAIGAVALGPRPGATPYTRSDLDFAAGLASQAVVAFENSWHFIETLEKKKIEQEVGLAAAIQKDLFPAAMPLLPGFELAARTQAARQVGGDYFDALPLGEAGSERPCLLCVADVSGKGIPASLLMSSIQATLRALLVQQPTVVDLVSRTSKLLYATTPSNKYATGILVLVNPVTARLRFVNAGHTDGILLRGDGSVERLRSTGPPLGLLPGIPFQEESVALNPGDLLALSSDGVTEAQGSDEEEFGDDRFVASLQACRHRSSEEIVASVFEDVHRFAEGAPQHDDITLMIVKRRG